MVTAREYRIARIVAVWRSDADELHVLPPCGRCREFIRQIDYGNIDTEVVLGRTTSAPLRDLLPFHEWPTRSNRRSDGPGWADAEGPVGPTLWAASRTVVTWASGPCSSEREAPLPGHPQGVRRPEDEP